MRLNFCKRILRKGKSHLQSDVAKVYLGFLTRFSERKIHRPIKIFIEFWTKYFFRNLGLFNHYLLIVREN